MDSFLSSLNAPDLEALLLLSRTPGFRMAALRPLWEESGSPLEILDRLRAEAKPAWKASLDQTERVFHPAKELERCQNLGIEILPFGSEGYPALLRESSDPPLVLYLKGSLIESDQAAVAVVGSRHPSLYGQEQARRFSRKLSAWGITIVSGFARGIDRAGHEAALEISHGRTLAVLGSGLDVIYPKEHQSLYEEISERGALMSEFALGTPPLAENFPKRNRIIAGLSLGIFVVEAHSRSGSLITAHLGAEEGREVFALPGRVDQIGSRGTHRLLKEGATLVESPEDILDALAPQLKLYVPSWPSGGESFDEEEQGFLNFFQRDTFTLDEIAGRGGYSIAALSALMTRLELKGAVRKRSDGRYERTAAKERV